MSKHSNLLITGGSGFIGTNISLEAYNRGWNVFVVDNMSRRGSEDNAKLLSTMNIPIARRDIVGFDGGGIKFDAIIHLAANTGIGVSLSEPFYDFEANAIGTMCALELARKNDSVFVYASTNKVYSSDINNIEVKENDHRYYWENAGINEKARTDGRHHTPYGVSKLTGDMYCQEYFESFGVRTVVNRMSCIYGLYQNGAEEQGWVDHFIRSNMHDGGIVNIYGDGKQVRDVLWGGDVARLYMDEVENIDSCAGQVFNVGGGTANTMSLLECMSLIESNTELPFTPNFMPWREADQKVYVSDIRKVKRLLGWHPTVGPEEGIKLMIERYKE